MPTVCTPILSPFEGRLERASGLHDPDKVLTYYFKDFIGRDGQAEVTLHIGRATQSEIRLRNENASRRHATVQCLASNHAILYTEEPINGLFVDGRPWIKPITLLVGMRIELHDDVLLVATNEHGSFPVAAETYEQFMRLAARLYGRYNLAASKIGRPPAAVGDACRPPHLRRRNRKKKAAARVRSSSPA